MKVTKIKMRRGREYSDNVLEIDSLYIPDCVMPGYYKKEEIHKYLKTHPNSIYVDMNPYPYLEPAISANGELYVRSELNQYKKDNLLNLPRR